MGPLSTYLQVNVTIPKSLIDRSDSFVICIMRHQLRKQFPVADMAQEQDDGPSRAQLLMHCVQIFCVDIFLQFLRRHRAHLDAADEIGAESLEMAADDPSQFPRR